MCHHRAEYEPTSYYDLYDLWLRTAVWLKYVLVPGILFVVGPIFLPVLLVLVGCVGLAVTIRAWSTRQLLRQPGLSPHKQPTVCVPALSQFQRLAAGPAQSDCSLVQAMQVSWEPYNDKWAVFDSKAPAKTFTEISTPRTWTTIDNELIGSAPVKLPDYLWRLGPMTVHGACVSDYEQEKVLAVLAFMHISGKYAMMFVWGNAVLVRWESGERSWVARKIVSRNGKVYFASGNSILSVKVAGTVKKARLRDYRLGVAEDVLDFAFLDDTKVVVVTCVELFLLDLETGETRLFRSLVSSSWSCLVSLLGHRTVSFRSVANSGSEKFVVLRSDGQLETFVH